MFTDSGGIENAPATSNFPPAWHPDPAIPGQLRWWSGLDWTDHVKAAAPPVMPERPVATPAQAAAVNPGQPFTPPDPRDRPILPTSPAEYEAANSKPQGLVEQNPLSFFAIGISATYLVLAAYTGIVLLGIIPASLAFRAFNRGEKLALVGMLAAGIAIASALTSFGV